MARPNIRQIEAFNAVMNGGSVTRAAEVLFVSQPAVSKLILAFESSCGLKLFQRGKGRLSPTPEARRLFAETEKFMTGVERIENAARAIRDAERGEIALVGYPALSLRALPRFAARFLVDRPDIHLTILTRNSPEVAPAMLSRMADFGISLLPTREPNLRCAHFANVSLVCAIPRGHRLAGTGPLDLRELETETLISLGHDDHSNRVVLEALAHAGTNPKRQIDVEMADTACTFAAEGLGVALVPSIASVGWENNGLTFRPLTQKVEMAMWLYTSSWEPMTRLARLLLDEVRAGVHEIENQFC